MYIICKKSKKSESTYLVFVVNGVFVSFDRFLIEKIAMTNGISKLDLNNLKVDEYIEITKIGG